MKDNIELLSPAGDKEKLIMALTYGADAVYLSGRSFGMRASSSNFNDDALKEAVNLVHDKGKKIYITCNTLPHEDELKELPEYLEFLQSLNVDALIIADLGVLRLANKHAPNIKKHVSTQLGVVNSETANMLQNLGADTAVLARECTLEEISKIHANSTIRLEAFVHGAMCVSFSGRCLLSEFLTNRDANRGKCAQPCRWKYHLVEENRPGEYYEITEDKGTYILNSNDLRMIEHIPELIQAGISSLKIEGRMKSAYYTAITTNAYRHVIDEGLSDVWIEETNKVSHRPYSTGFFYGYPGQNYSTSSYSQNAEIVAVAEDSSTFSLRNKFFKGEHLEIISPNSLPFSFESPIDSGNVAMEKFTMDIPCEINKYSILRRVK